MNSKLLQYILVILSYTSYAPAGGLMGLLFTYWNNPETRFCPLSNLESTNFNISESCMVPTVEETQYYLDKIATTPLVVAPLAGLLTAFVIGLGKAILKDAAGEFDRERLMLDRERVMREIFVGRFAERIAQEVPNNNAVIIDMPEEKALLSTNTRHRLFKKVKTVAERLSELNVDQIPDDYLCPLEMVIMEDPVILKGDGRTYDRKSIEEWLRTKKTSPYLQKQLTDSDCELIPNNSMKSSIQNFLSEKIRESLSTNQEAKLNLQFHPPRLARSQSF